ncbi:flagellar hook-basal body complex protein [Acidithiobacillus thiooxidans]|uniref:flagellar hook-basal body complex protein n=1 Tax=Acidithiobacillus thiooxidans TaxID=930 RepID=UPI000983894A|nr:flagellar hook-basal body complex protein [Acidithiobacillus thiooxidans]
MQHYTSGVGTLQFNAYGQETSSTSTPISISWADGAAPSSIAVNFSGSTNYNSPNSVITNNSNGYSAGQLSGLSIDSGGNIFGRYSNGESQLMGQISLTRFPDNNGLQNLGNNYWAETYVSGQPLSGGPGSSNLGVLQAGAVEQSNVDISKDLVNLIVAQQAYQANAQTIKTQNTVVQTLLSL